MDIEKAKRSYNDQMQRARVRGIGWGFTFKTWVRTWRLKVGPKWQSLRGRGKHDLCMARKGDAGTYCPSNVECITNSQNSKDKVASGRQAFGMRQGSAKLDSKQVADVYQHNGCLRELQAKYKVSYTNVWDVRSRRSRKRETVGLALGSGCQCGIKGIRCVRGF